MDFRNRLIQSKKKLQNVKRPLVSDAQCLQKMRKPTIESQCQNPNYLGKDNCFMERLYCRNSALISCKQKSPNVCLFNQRNSFPSQHNKKIKNIGQLEQIDRNNLFKNIEFIQVNTIQDKIDKFRDPLHKLNSHHIRRQQKDMQYLNLNSQQFYFRFSHKNQENSEPILKTVGLQVKNVKMLMKKQQKQHTAPPKEIKVRQRSLKTKKQRNEVDLKKIYRLVSVSKHVKEEQPQSQISRWDNGNDNFHSTSQDREEVDDLNIYCGLQCFKTLLNI